jgi:tRNA pseudouridine13 synthase
MSLNLGISHWHYHQTPPLATATFKQEAEDFQVIEELGYELTGDGEHIFLYIQKQNLNTAFVAENIARFANVPLRNVTYAGRKDKFALCKQWIGVHMPGKSQPDWSKLQLEGLTILKVTRHNKKLRTGQLKGNRFIIKLRHVSQMEDLVAHLKVVATQGVPNYFGEQRFGQQRRDDTEQMQVGGNLVLAEKMINGEAIRNRNKRSMAISALRSWLFNEFLSARLSQFGLHQLVHGDAMNLQGSNSYFIAEDNDPSVAQRFDQRDIAPTLPMWGKGDVAVKDDCLAFEQSIAKQFPSITKFLANNGLRMERRAAIIWPEQLDWQADRDTLTVSFSLPAGCFATSVLRECVQVQEGHFLPSEENTK